MTRRRHIGEGVVHHVMNRGVNRRRVFFADADRLEFGEQLAAIHADQGVETLAYCLMDNHFHLLVRDGNGMLSTAMQRMMSLYTRRTNARVGRDGPLFRGRFHSIPVTTDAYLAWAARYIHRNPLDLPGVRSPIEYRWSSYRSYVGLRGRPPFLVTDLIGGLFDHDPAAIAAFTETVDGRIEGRSGPVGLDDVLQVVRFAIAVTDVHVDDPTCSPRVLERTLLVLLAESCTDPRLASVLTDAVGAPSRAAYEATRRRAMQRLATDPMLRSCLATVRTAMPAVGAP